MLYLLIDNCCLRQIIDKYTYSKQILTLEDLVAQNHIRLLVPDTLMDEWQKHKGTWQAKSERKLLNDGQSRVDSIDNSMPVSENTQHIANQFEAMDELLQKGLRLPIPQVIKDETHIRLKQKLAPFINKPDSVNDWEIFGSAALHCINQGISELLFASGNTNEFSSAQDKTMLHESLADRFKDLEISYFTNINDCIKILESGTYRLSGFLASEIIPSSKYSFKSSLRKNPIDGLYDLFNGLYKGINVLPYQFMKKYYPITAVEKSKVYDQSFGLVNVSDELIYLLQNIEINDDFEVDVKNPSVIEGVKDPEQKLCFIARILFINLMLRFTNQKGDQKININKGIIYSQEPDHESLHEFNFNRLFPLLRSETEDSISLKVAYLHYKVGNYLDAYDIYQRIITARPENFFTYFIAKYNLKHLGYLFQNIFANEHIDHERIQLLKKIDPIEEAVKLKSQPTDYDLLVYIAKEEFFNQAFQEIKDLTDQIVRHYESQLSGGWASNDLISSLLEQYYRLDAFLNLNYIIFDGYTDYQKLFNTVTEGLFASYAIKDQGKRLNNLDVFLVTKFIMYSNEQEMLRLFRKYRIKDIRFKNPGSKKEATLLEIITNLLGNPGLLDVSIKSGTDHNNRFFPTLYNKYFRNLMTILSLLSAKDIEVNKIAIVLLRFLQHQQLLFANNLECINHFLLRFKGKIHRVTLLKLFVILYEQDRYHEEGLYQAAIRAYPSGFKLHLSNSRIKKFLDNHTKICEKCNSRHNFSFVRYLFKVMDDNGKKYVRTYMQRQLTKEFDFEIFSLCTITGIIPQRRDRVLELVKEVKAADWQQHRHYLFGRRNMLEIDHIDELMNLCFRFKLNTTDPAFNEIRNINTYYLWLCNMDDFDYSDFNMNWINKSSTIYFYNRMSRSKVFKEFLRNYLTHNNDPIAEWVLLKISCF